MIYKLWGIHWLQSAFEEAVSSMVLASFMRRTFNIQSLTYRLNAVAVLALKNSLCFGSALQQAELPC
jgi:hypothetical protein